MTYCLQGNLDTNGNTCTEEVFTTPDRMRADGIVHSVMPLVHHGQVVDDFWLRFEDGRVVESGTYDELIRANGFFADLVARQQIDGPEEQEK